ncbi:hypothetical protein HUG15_16805 [Salicibibacter cibarius]|uniref:Uncharacterized protein n=1 Tax=Salicibibacter cibarius TaxID=2743000 RepID=A0A7T7CCK5_9BACI|nr:hypothetical protein [Salicibibacter cibarius]QQK77072.1 hypothetical protein HUG15_16805 [Salicibibacter cibarius]
MDVTINSPLQPILFRQKILFDGKKMGYLATVNLFKYVIGRNSYKVKVSDITIALIENRKENWKRNWTVQHQSKNADKEKIGSIKMTSNATDTLTHNATFFDIDFENKQLRVKKPYMQLGKAEAYLYSEDGSRLAYIRSSYTKRPRFKKTMHLDYAENYSHTELAFFICILNLALYES